MMERRSLPMEELWPLLQLQLNSGGRARLPVTGYSMLPMLRNQQDAVELIPVAARQKRGDVILYRRENGAFVLHRIIRVKPDGYICCGDNEADKETVAPQQLVAVMDGFVRRGKHYSKDHLGYRIYKNLWVCFFSLRRSYIWVRRRMGRLLRRCRPGRK